MISIVSMIFAILMHGSVASSAAQTSLLHQWAQKDSPTKVKQFEAVQKERRKSINWDSLNDKGQTPLMIAVANGNDQMVIFLLEHGVDSSIVDNSRKTAFDYAPAGEKGEMIKAALIKRTKTKNGQTLLTQTIKNGDMTHFNVLIAHKATDINKSNMAGQTPLHVAVLAHNERPENKIIMIALLQLCDLNVNAQDTEGNTPLHYATQLGDVELVMALTGAGAQATIANKDGKKPIQIIGKKNSKLSKQEKGAIETQLKAIELSPIDPKRAKQHCTAPSGVPRATAAQDTAAAGTTPNVKKNQEQAKHYADNKNQEKAALEQFDENGQTLLTQAACEGNLKNVTMLIEMGALVNTPDQKINTPLLAAVKCYQMPINGFRHRDVIAYLLEKGASILIYDGDGKNPLHYAVEHENKPIIHILLTHLAKDPNRLEIVNSQDRNGDTPLHYAAATQSFEIVQDLLACGANPNIQNKAGQYPADVLGTKTSISENTRNNIAKNKDEIKKVLAVEPATATARASSAAAAPSMQPSASTASGGSAAAPAATAPPKPLTVSTQPAPAQAAYNSDEDDTDEVDSEEDDEWSKQSKGRARTVSVTGDERAPRQAPGHRRNRTESIRSDTVAKGYNANASVLVDDEDGVTHIKIPLGDNE